MVTHRLAGTLCLLLTVQFAVLGGAPPCAGVYSHAAGSIEAPAHAGHGTHGSTSPCAPAHGDSGPQHSPLGCLAMTGCATAGIAALAAPQLITPDITAEHDAPSRASLVSVSSTPETPPPRA